MTTPNPKDCFTLPFNGADIHKKCVSPTHFPEEPNLWTGKQHKGLYFRREDWNHYAICIYSEFWGLVNFYDGVACLVGTPYITKQSKIDCMKDKSTNYWPYGSTYLKYRTWDASVIPDMVDKDGHNRFAETIIERVKTILDEVERKQLPEKDKW